MLSRCFNFLVNDLNVFKFGYILLEYSICFLYRKKVKVRKSKKKKFPTYPNFFEQVTPNTYIFLLALGRIKTYPGSFQTPVTELLVTIGNGWLQVTQDGFKSTLLQYS